MKNTLSGYSCPATLPQNVARGHQHLALPLSLSAQILFCVLLLDLYFSPRWDFFADYTNLSGREKSTIHTAGLPKVGSRLCYITKQGLDVNQEVKVALLAVVFLTRDVRD